MRKMHFVRVSSLWLLILLVVVSIPLGAVSSQTAQESAVVAAVYYDSQDQLNSIGSKYDVWAVHADQGYVEVLLRPEQQVALAKAGFRVEVLREIPATAQALLDPRYYYYDNYVSNSNSRYLTTWLQTINAAHPDLTELVDVGNAWQADHAGYHRDMWVLRVTNEDPMYGPIESKPAFFLYATIHAREVATPELVIRYINFLLDGYDGLGGYGVDADVTWLVNHNVAYLMVMANPDGHVQNELNTSAYRRKNMDNDDGCSSPSSWGVDLNRNHSFLWGCCGGSSSYACDETYRGPSAGSEPETQAFQNYFATIMPDQNGPNGDNEIPPAAPDDARGLFISLHSYSDVVLWPWYLPGYPQPPNVTQLQAIGRKFADFNGYNPSGTIGYTVDGATDYWTYGKFGIASFTIEVGSSSGTCGGFFPSYDCLDGYGTRDFWAENRPVFLYSHKIARSPYTTVYGPDTLSPSISDPGEGEAIVTLTATIQDQRYGSDPLKPVMGAEYFIGEPGLDGLGVAMSPTDGAWGGTMEAVNATIDTSALEPGTYYVLVHGKNGDGKWGPFSAAWLNVGATQPTVHVGDIVMGYKLVSGRYRIGADVPVFDQNGVAVVGASVTVEWTLPNSKTKIQTALTSATGKASFRIVGRTSGTYTVAVTDVTATGYDYDPAQNFETSEELVIP